MPNNDDTPTARSQLQTASPSALALTSPTKAEIKTRLAYFSRLAALFPPRPDQEAQLASYLDEAMDIPVPWLVETANLIKGSGEKFLPSLPEFRKFVGRKIQDCRRQASGRGEASGIGQSRFDHEAQILWARRHCPLGIAQLRKYYTDHPRNPSPQRRNPPQPTRRWHGATKGPTQPSDVLRGILERLKTVDEKGKPCQLSALAREIFRAGVMVPGPEFAERGKHSLAVQGRFLALMIASMRYGRDPIGDGLVTPFCTRDFERYDRAMTDFVRLDPDKADATWWWEVRDTIRSRAEGATR